MTAFDIDAYLANAGEAVRQRAACRPGQNAAALRTYLREMRSTALAKDFGFDRFDTEQPDDVLMEHVRRHLPLTTYADYRPYVERIRRGEADVLGRGQPKALTLSGGSTNAHERKLVPLYSELLSNQSVATYAAALYTDSVPPGSSYINLVKPVNLQSVERTESGVPIAMASSFTEGAFAFAGAFSERFEGVPHSLKLRLHANQRGRWIVQALAALGQPDIRYVFAIYPNVIAAFFHRLESDWPLVQQVCRDGDAAVLAQAGLDDDAVALVDSVLLARMDADRRRQVLGTRAEDLLSELGNMWPQLKFAVAVATGGYAQYRPLLRRRFGLDVHTLSYGASEAALGTCLFAPQPWFVPNPRTYFEFIEQAHANDVDPPTLLLDQTKTDHAYEVVMTSPQSGFFRYRIGDLVILRGGPRDPRLEVVGRTLSRLSVAHEMTQEVHVTAAIARLADECSFDIGLAVVGRDLPGMCYAFFFETGSEALAEKLRAMAPMLDDLLCRENDLYAYYRREAVLRPPKVHSVPAGTYEALLERKATIISRDINQVKPGIVLSDDDTAFFLAATGVR